MKEINSSICDGDKDAASASRIWLCLHAGIIGASNGVTEAVALSGRDITASNEDGCTVGQITVISPVAVIIYYQLRLINSIYFSLLLLIAIQVLIAVLASISPSSESSSAASM